MRAEHVGEGMEGAESMVEPSQKNSQGELNRNLAGNTNRPCSNGKNCQIGGCSLRHECKYSNECRDKRCKLKHPKKEDRSVSETNKREKDQEKCTEMSKNEEQGMQYILHSLVQTVKELKTEIAEMKRGSNENK